MFKRRPDKFRVILHREHDVQPNQRELFAFGRRFKIDDDLLFACRLIDRNG
jgi:hypothetical protein